MWVTRRRRGVGRDYVKDRREIWRGRGLIKFRRSNNTSLSLSLSRARARAFSGRQAKMGQARGNPNGSTADDIRRAAVMTIFHDVSRGDYVTSTCASVSSRCANVAWNYDFPKKVGDAIRRALRSAAGSTRNSSSRIFLFAQTNVISVASLSIWSNASSLRKKASEAPWKIYIYIYIYLYIYIYIFHGASDAFYIYIY
jgi:hypothetical protein